MAISFVSAGTSGAGSGASITPGLPGSIASGDLLLAVINSTTGPVGPNTSADWAIAAYLGGSSSRMVWYHWYDGDDPDRQFNTDVSGGAFVGGIAAFRGVKYSATLSQFFRKATAYGRDGTDTSIEFDSFAMVAGEMEVLCAAADDDNDINDLANYTAAFDPGAGNNFETSSGTPDGMVTLFYRLLASDATLSPTLTQAASDAWYNGHFALVPATGWANIAKINGVTATSFSKVNGTAVASISKVNGVAV